MPQAFFSSCRQHLSLIISVIGALMMVAGIWRQEIPVIFMKAVNVCFQCIGIG